MHLLEGLCFILCRYIESQNYFTGILGFFFSFFRNSIKYIEIIIVEAYLFIDGLEIFLPSKYPNLFVCIYCEVILAVFSYSGDCVLLV